MENFKSIIKILFSFSITVLLFIILIRYLPVEDTTLGIDWKTIWNGIHNGNVTYGSTNQNIGGLYTPPWGILFLYPIGMLSFEISWAVIITITIIFLILSIPLKENQLDKIGIILLIVSFPAMRNFADGNLEGLIIGGISLLIIGIKKENAILTSIGLLLTTIKTQETWLLCITIIIFLHKYMTKSFLIKTLLITGCTISISMLIWGYDWIKILFFDEAHGFALTDKMGKGSLIDITLANSLNRLRINHWIILIIRISILLTTSVLVLISTYSKEISKYLIALTLSASMLLAPYTSGNSFLTIVAFGIIPLLQENILMGAILLTLTNIPYLASIEIIYNYSSFYWTSQLLIIWMISGYYIISTKKIGKPFQLKLPHDEGDERGTKS